jgi:hypothetical protein
MSEQWEHFVFALNPDAQPSAYATTLDILGKDGWQLVGIVMIGKKPVAFLKRPAAKSSNE